MRLLKSLLALTLVFALAASSFAISLNEIRIDQPGSDVNEYFELFGAPGASLDGITYVVIGDNSTNISGNVEMALDLTGQSLDANGYFFAYEAGSGFTGGFETVLSFENSDNVTHLLVTGWTGNLNDDLDVDDDCNLDVMPWASIVDGVALIEEPNPPAATECHYGSVAGSEVGPDGSFVPGHIYRSCTTGDWVIGGFGYPGDDTPGTPNLDCPVSNDADSFGTIKSRF